MRVKPVQLLVLVIIVSIGLITLAFTGNSEPNLAWCPEPWDMTWLGKVTVNKSSAQPENIIVGDIELGGHWKPPHCLARRKVAILIPYRNRKQHLWIFLRHMHPFMQAQKMEYTFYVIEQGPVCKRFNRAKLLNIGVLEASKEKAWDAYIFHDVDLLPHDTRNIYDCPDHPRHMSVAIDKFRYRLLYEAQFGGVSCMTTEQFYAVNGYSNAYFGWGGEDDDIATRMDIKGLQRVRYHPHVSRYSTISHRSRKHERNRPEIHRLLDATEYLMEFDGVRSTKYNISKIEKNALFTKISVDFVDDATYYQRKLQGKKF